MKKSILFAALLTGCATSSQIVTPSGNAGQAITCYSGITGCLEKASELCPAGYNLLGSEDQSHTGLIYNQWTGGYQTIQNNTQTIIVECKQ